MSTSGPRYHIPFPKAFLSLNTPTQKTSSDAITASPEAEVAPHNFLSNRPVVPRHSSISSVSSTASSTGAPSTLPVNTADSPTLKASVPAFLALNSKFTPPPVTFKDVSGEKTTFLSNKA